MFCLENKQCLIVIGDTLYHMPHFQTVFRLKKLPLKIVADTRMMIMILLDSYINKINVYILESLQVLK